MSASQNTDAVYASWAEANHFEGRFTGNIQIGQDLERVELQVRAGDKGTYKATLQFRESGSRRGGGGSTSTDSVELAGTLEDYTLVLIGDDLPIRLQYIHGRFTALDDENEYAGHLTRVPLQAPP